MSAIIVRRPAFEWPTDLELLPFPDDPPRSCELVALSFTLPYLEPYLIRTMRVAAKQIDDIELLADMKGFAGQEAQHYQNHVRVNDVVRAQLGASAATAMRRLEDELEADYRRFSAKRSLAFNLAYAEGFEAMTFALARSIMSPSGVAGLAPDWADLVAWHLGEEVEHRTVTFDAYEAIVGRYPYRVVVGSWAQGHFLRCLIRMATVLQRATIGSDVGVLRVACQSISRNWRNGMIPGMMAATLPSYNPRHIPISDDVRLIASAHGIAL